MSDLDKLELICDALGWRVSTMNMGGKLINTMFIGDAIHCGNPDVLLAAANKAAKGHIKRSKRIKKALKKAGLK